MKWRCWFRHKWQVEKRFELAGYNTIYGLKCARCAALRCTVNGARLVPPGPDGPNIPTKKARAWLEEISGRPVMAPFVWYV